MYITKYICTCGLHTLTCVGAIGFYLDLPLYVETERRSEEKHRGEAWGLEMSWT